MASYGDFADAGRPPGREGRGRRNVDVAGAADARPRRDGVGTEGSGCGYGRLLCSDRGVTTP
jgi:hypothetical protein